MKKYAKYIIVSLIIVLIISIDLGLFREYAPYNYSVIRHLYCIAIIQENYDHIEASYGLYASSGDYMKIYTCGNEYYDKFPLV